VGLPFKKQGFPSIGNAFDFILVFTTSLLSREKAQPAGDIHINTYKGKHEKYLALARKNTQ
jgi:hypothetical protein